MEVWLSRAPQNLSEAPAWQATVSAPRVEPPNGSIPAPDVLAVLAHELRNPLGALLAAAQLLRTMEPPRCCPARSEAARQDDSRVARASEIIGRQVLHMGRIIDDLL